MPIVSQRVLDPKGVADGYAESSCPPTVTIIDFRGDMLDPRPDLPTAYRVRFAE